MTHERSRVILVATVFAGALGLGPVSALASPQPPDGPRTEAATGTFSASPVNVKQRTCEGDDGAYLELRGTFAGQIVSSDPRLTGELEFTARRALVNVTTGLGAFEGRFRILDPESGRQQAEGEFFTVVTEGSLNHGFAVGTLSDAALAGEDEPRGRPSERFFASYNATLDAALNATGAFGGVGDPRTPAVIQTGRCRGPFVPFP